MKFPQGQDQVMDKSDYIFTLVLYKEWNDIDAKEVSEELNK